MVSILLVAVGGATAAVSATGGTATAAPRPLAAVVTEDQVVKDAVPPARKSARVDKAKTVLTKLGSTTTSGSWISPETGRLVVGVTSADAGQAASSRLDAAGLGQADVEVVENSQSELDAIVTGVYDDPGMADISSAAHDYVLNAVVLTSEVPVTDELRAQVYENYGDAAVIQQEPAVMHVMTREADTSPFYAGGWLGLYNQGRNCTVGYSWVTGAGNPRMITAGHCYPTGSSDWRNSAATDYVHTYIYREGVAVDTTYTDGTGTVGADGDLALINTVKDHNGNTIDREGAARMWTGGPTSDTSTSVTSVDSWAANGDHVCYSGMRRGVQCGTDIDDNGNGGYNVVDHDASYTDSTSGDVITHVAKSTKGWGKCIQPGDSGSPVYINTPGVGVAAHGILSGGGGGDSDQYIGKYEPASCRMFYTEIGQAYDHWDAGHIEQS